MINNKSLGHYLQAGGTKIVQQFATWKYIYEILIFN